MAAKWTALMLCLMLIFTGAGRCAEIDLNAGEAAAPPLPGDDLPPLGDAPLEDAPPLRPDCAAILLAEQDSGEILFEMNADTPRPVASITKVMTILLTLEALAQGRLRAGDEVQVSRQAAGMGGSQALLDVGERQTVDVLLKTMIVGSANDAAVALAEAMYGSEAACVEAMNRRAEALGLRNTRFVNCTGLPAEGQHTTARDVAAMSRRMFAHPLYYQYAGVWMEDIDHGDGRVTQLVNTNKMIRTYDGCDGGKTGSTREAGYCVTATAQRGGMRLIAVVLGATSGQERFAIAGQMLDYGFANYRRYPVAVRGTRVRGEMPVTGGSQSGVALRLDGDLTLLVAKGQEQAIELTPRLPEALEAPVAEGQRVGEVEVALEGRPVARVPLAACEGVEAAGFAHALRRLWRRWGCGG